MNCNFLIIVCEILLCNFSKTSLTTAEIADFFENPDDDVRDPDFVVTSEEEDSSEEDNDSDAPVADDQDPDGKCNDLQGEVRVYMQPPVERPDGDTDRDSGNKCASYIPVPVKGNPDPSV